MNAPKKYRVNYADFIIKSGLKALQYAQIANGIYLSASTSEEAFNKRELLLEEAKGIAENIATTADIFLEHMRKIDGVNVEKILKQEQYIGEITGTISSLIDGVMKSDKKRYREYKDK